MSYTGKDGLKLLKYLEINISERDCYLFEQEWSKLGMPATYSDKPKINGNIVEATNYLYTTFLPAISNLSHEEFLGEYRLRTQIYENKLKTSGIQEKLKHGTPLDMIL